MEATTQATTVQTPALSLDWQALCGDPSVMTAGADVRTDDSPIPLRLRVRVQWDGWARIDVGTATLPWVRMGRDMASGQAEAARRLALLAEVLLAAE